MAFHSPSTYVPMHISLSSWATLLKLGDGAFVCDLVSTMYMSTCPTEASQEEG